MSVCDACIRVYDVSECGVSGMVSVCIYVHTSYACVCMYARMCMWFTCMYVCMFCRSCSGDLASDEAEQGGNE